MGKLMGFDFINVFRFVKLRYLTSLIAATMFISIAACGQKEETPVERGGADETTASRNNDEAADAGEGGAGKVPVKTAKREILSPSQDIDANDPAIKGLPKVRIETSMGPITVALYQEQSPQSVENFLSYINGRHYTRTIFHRVIPGFMIQGGGFSSYLEQRKTKDPVPYEGDNGLGNDRGTIAMARTSNPDSATAQWYINHEDNADLNHGARGPDVPGYTVFGRVISGMNIVDAIALVETSTQVSGNGQTLNNVPVDPVIINNVGIVE